MVGPFRSTSWMAGLICAMLLTLHARADNPPAQEASTARRRIEEAVAKARGGSPPLPPAPTPAEPTAPAPDVLPAPSAARTPPEKLPPDLEVARFSAEAASRLEARGVRPVRGDLNSPDTLAAAAR